MPPATLLTLGPMEASVSNALNSFSNQKSIISVPLISPGWDRVTGMSLGSSDSETVHASLRRLSDAGEMFSLYYRDLDSRSSSVSPSNSSQRIDLSQLDKKRLQDLLSPGGQKRDSQPRIGRTQWRLALQEKGQGVAYIKDDGQAIHIRSVSSSGVVLGYGWVNSIMHYLNLDAKFPAGRPVALFENREVHATDWSFASFLDLVHSVLGISPSSPDYPNAKAIISGSGSRQKTLTWEGSLADEKSLAECYRSLNLAKDFSVETDQLVDGSRNPAFRTVNPPVPRAAFRFLAGQGRILSSVYRNGAEIELSQDQRSRLQFPKVSSRPPLRVS